MKATEPFPVLDDDGLITSPIGAWGEEKYRLVVNYARMFAGSMKNKWSRLIYIDLFAGSGRSKIRGTNRIVSASPLLVLGLVPEFSRYVFCELDDEKLQALQTRVEDAFPGRDVRIVAGDANQRVKEITAEIPKAAKGSTVLCLCFSDPYSLKNLHFETLRRISKRFVDHLVMIPTGYDANRNIDAHYTKASSAVLDDFLGDGNWRPAWAEARSHGLSGDLFLTTEFGKRMAALDYVDPGADKSHLIKSDEKNLSLYRLVLYSRHPLAQKFWKEAKKYSTPQGSLFA